MNRHDEWDRGRAETIRKQRRAVLEQFADSPEWALVKEGLTRQQERLADRIAGGSALTEQEIREEQGAYKLLRTLLTRPVDYIAQFLDENKGDER